MSLNDQSLVVKKWFTTLFSSFLVMTGIFPEIPVKSLSGSTVAGQQSYFCLIKGELGMVNETGIRCDTIASLSLKRVPLHQNKSKIACTHTGKTRKNGCGLSLVVHSVYLLSPSKWKFVPLFG